MRYLPLTNYNREQMRQVVGVNDIDELFSDVPKDALNPKLDLPNHKSEFEVERHLAHLSSQNHVAGHGPFFAGAGAYRHHVPATVDHIIQRSEFLTAYTPYQPEIAQGT
ncbi:MAG: glycine dehydrogenase, partial [Pseudomonadota bacterium]